MNIDKEFTEVLNILETDFGWLDTKNMEENNKESLKEFMTVVKKLTLTDVSQLRELLVAWEKRRYSLEEWKIVEKNSIEFIDDWLSN